MGLRVVPGLGGGDEPFTLDVTSIVDVVLFVCGYHFGAFSCGQHRNIRGDWSLLTFPIVPRSQNELFGSLWLVVGVSRSLT